MTRIVILAIVMAAFATSGFAGFKMFVPGQKEPAMIFEDPDPTPQPRFQPQQTYQPETKPAYTPARKQQPRDDFDQSGVEWRQSRGYYSGHATKEMTQKFGYRAGKYRLEYEYKARRYFGIWMHTRRGLSKLLVNRVGRADTHVDVILPKDDEVWFEVDSPFGNWEFTFERIR